ncbi:MAG: hypothetical protein LBG19_08085 [Prevotellaceae bacterium]|nr:hypothetical protein [Prevotellaceae bacterium]
MTIVTTDNRELTVLQLGKLVKYTNEQGEEDWRAEPCNLYNARITRITSWRSQ